MNHQLIDGLQAASNIGCHIRPWKKAPLDIQQLFHHYQSKDDRRLFHAKLIIAFDKSTASALPHYIYLGSANLSQSAWGALEVDKRGNEGSSDMKVTKISNYECGVVVPGHLIGSLLESGTPTWQDGIIPYVRPALRYE